MANHRSSHQGAINEADINYRKAIDYYTLKKKNFLSLAYNQQVAREANDELLKNSYDKEQQWAEEFLKIVHKMYKAISFYYKEEMGAIDKDNKEINRQNLKDTIEIDATRAASDAAVEKKIKGHLENYYKSIGTNSKDLDVSVDLTFKVYKDVLSEDKAKIKNKDGPLLSAASLGNGAQSTLGFVEEVLMEKVLKNIERNITFIAEKKVVDLLKNMENTGAYKISRKTLTKGRGKDISSDLAIGFNNSETVKDNNIFLADITGGYSFLKGSTDLVGDFGQFLINSDANQIFNMIQAGGFKYNNAYSTAEMFGFSLKRASLKENFVYTNSSPLKNYINDVVFRSYVKSSKKNREIRANRSENDPTKNATWNSIYAYFEMIRQVSRVIIPLVGPHNIAVMDKNGLVWTDDFLKKYGLRMKIATDFFKDYVREDKKDEVFPYISSNALILYTHEKQMGVMNPVYTERTRKFTWKTKKGEERTGEHTYTAISYRFGAVTQK